VRIEFLLLFLVVGAGNYLMRCLPFLWALRRGGPSREEPDMSAGGTLPRLLPLVGPSVVAALLVTSMLPQPPGGAFWEELARSGAALALTLLVAVCTTNLGLTVLVGVTAYWLVSLVI
jgi:branched-subunit amino acid transport protein